MIKVDDFLFVDTAKKLLPIAGLFSKNVLVRDPYYFALTELELVTLLDKLPDVPPYKPDIYECNAQADFILACMKKEIPGIAACYIRGVNKKPAKAHAWASVLVHNPCEAEPFRFEHIKPKRDAFNRLRAVIDTDDENINHFSRIEEVRA